METGQPTSDGTPLPISRQRGGNCSSGLSGPEVRLIAAYEARRTVYALYAHLARLGLRCLVEAPSPIPKRTGDRVKTARGDALDTRRAA
jgi:hypothetical protein